MKKLISHHIKEKQHRLTSPIILIQHNAPVETIVKIVNQFEKSLDIKKIRLFEGRLRVHDFSYSNYRLNLSDNSKLIFSFRFKGSPSNNCYFSDVADVYVDYKQQLLKLFIKGFVYWLDGSRRYQNRQNLEKIIEDIDYKYVNLDYDL